jgi:hypothetical protein
VSLGKKAADAERVAVPSVAGLSVAGLSVAGLSAIERPVETERQDDIR